MTEFSSERIRPNELINKLEINFLNKIGNRKLVCWGASCRWPDINRIIFMWDLVDFFVDVDSQKWGESFYSKLIKPPKEIELLDKDEYAVVILASAINKISLELDQWGWEKDINYFNIYQYTSVFDDMSAGPFNQYLKFLDTVPPNIKDMTIQKENSRGRIGIVLLMETLDYVKTYVPYAVSLFLMLKWKGYDVKLIVERIHWDSDIIAFEGACELVDKKRDMLLRKLKNLVPEKDILFVDFVGDAELSEEDEKECETVAEYSAGWSKWCNLLSVRSFTKEELQKKYEKIYKRNLPFIKLFFEKNHFDSINVGTGLHKSAGLYRYVARRKGIRISSQDGERGTTMINAYGPASFGDEISWFMKNMWCNIGDKEEIMHRARQMWEKRRGASAEHPMSYEEFMEKKKEGYSSISFQSPYEKSIQEYDVIIPLNLMYDAAALGVVTIFEDIKQWLIETLDYVIGKLSATVLIREHPSCRSLPPGMTNFELYAAFPEILEPYENNEKLRYVKSGDEINLYQYIEKSKVVIPWTSTVGVEAGIMGKNVLVHTDVYYKDAAFASFVRTKSEYFEKIKACIRQEQPLVMDKQLAYEDALKYFYYSMNRSLCTDFTMENTNDSGWEFKDFDELLNARGVDDIIQIVAEGIPSAYLIERQCKN